MNNVKLGFGILAGLLLLITIFSSVSFVAAGYRAVVFNKFTGNISKELEPGLNFITPFVCKAKKYDLKTTQAAYKMTGLSSDSQTIDMEIVVNSKLRGQDIGIVYKTIQGDIKDVLLFNAVVDTAKTELGKFTINEIAKNRQSLKTAIENSLKIRMEKNYMDILNVSVTDINYSAEYEKSIQDKMISEQQALQAKYAKEKKQYESEAKAIENEKLASTISPMVLQQKWIEKWNGELPSVMTSGQSMMLNYSDLKK